MPECLCKIGSFLKWPRTRLTGKWRRLLVLIGQRPENVFCCKTPQCEKSYYYTNVVSWPQYRWFLKLCLCVRFRRQPPAVPSQKPHEHERLPNTKGTRTQWELYHFCQKRTKWSAQILLKSTTSNATPLLLNMVLDELRWTTVWGHEFTFFFLN